ncbi:hypothetical protein NDU88_006690 [Pleurodeles waltl]|uniref:Uncharacterized protein n=1 Tax=Pleurodeles waltl TaxID=8319 RepID=A0AAV7TYB6_PLEWA|nr:hypothetical protein NDU88_006690 [Pleurodeles waltl]
MPDHIKRSVVLCFAKCKSPDVLLLQKTHLLGTRFLFLSRYGYGCVYLAAYSRGSHGVAWGVTIVGGDFNMMVCPDIDGSKTLEAPRSAASRLMD